VGYSVYQIFHERTFEPKKRMCGGGFKWVSHRFPIKGGISFRDTMIADAYLHGNSMMKWVVVKETDGWSTSIERVGCRTP
jgi:hypothetical protein